jgi:hypothetical protein
LNPLSRKLRDLEDNVLELPEDDDILLHIGDDDEQQLHEHARRIRDSLKVQAEEIINDISLTLEQQNELAKHVISQLTERETDILDESDKFIDYRLMRLIYKRFVSGYPHQKDDRVLMRVVWFFMEMEKQNHVNFFTDSEWEHNRNEDDPAFDDFAWWDAIDKKIKEIYPSGVFTEKSFEDFEAEIDRRWSLEVKKYYDAHPEEREALVNGLNKKIEELKKNG